MWASMTFLLSFSIVGHGIVTDDNDKCLICDQALVSQLFGTRETIGGFRIPAFMVREQRNVVGMSSDLSVADVTLIITSYPSLI